jgi:hypothetical protein
LSKSRKIIDWEAIEKEYSLGQKSIRALASEFSISHTAIQKRIKKEGWVQDKSKEVRQKTKAGLLSCQKEVANEVATPTREDIQKAVQSNIEIIRSHRKSIGRGRELVEVLSLQLAAAADSREELKPTIEAETSGPNQAARRNSMLKAVALPSHATILRDLSTALKNLIPLERQAFNLDEDGLVSVDEILQIAERINPKLAATMREHLKNA